MRINIELSGITTWNISLLPNCPTAKVKYARPFESMVLLHCKLEPLDDGPYIRGLRESFELGGWRVARPERI
jgi:hypothetical protein